jgi:hypothetical protein
VRAVTALPANHISRRSVIRSIPAEVWFLPATTTNDPLGRGQQDLQPEVPDYRDAFCNQERELAVISSTFVRACSPKIARTRAQRQIYTAPETRRDQLTMQEIEEDAGQYRPRMAKQSNSSFEEGRRTAGIRVERGDVSVASHKH